jgi:hypothetical protein
MLENSFRFTSIVFVGVLMVCLQKSLQIESDENIMKEIRKSKGV